MQTLVTERLILEDFRMDFLADFYKYASVDGVGECAGWPHHTSLEGSKMILEEFIRSGKDYAIVDKKLGKCIGSLGVKPDTYITQLPETRQKFPLKRAVELGYVLNKDYWGKGLMTEVVKRVIDYLFTEDKYDVIFISHYDFNKRSDRVIFKCGLHYWFTIKNKYVQLLNKSYDDLVFYITREEYLSHKKPLE